LNKQSLEPSKYEVIVVDDGSSDGSAEAACKLGARVVGQPALGAAAARNRGVQEAGGEIVLFTDADCVADPQWVERLSAPLCRDGVQGTVGRCVSDQRQWIASLIQVELDERYSTMGHHERIDFLNSGNCGFRRELLSKNPFDESFRWLEDVELSFRLAQNGNRMIFVPDAQVEHPHPESLRAYVMRKFHYASFAPSIFRRYPSKTFSDSRTPVNRRLQLIVLGLAALSFPFALLGSGALVVSAMLLMASVLCSLPIILRAFGKSFRLGLAAPFFVLMGNVGFIVGAFWGFFTQRRGNYE